MVVILTAPHLPLTGEGGGDTDSSPLLPLTGDGGDTDSSPLLPLTGEGGGDIDSTPLAANRRGWWW